MNLDSTQSSYPNRYVWIFSAFFAAFFIGGLMFKNSNPINAFLIYKNLSSYQPATFTATRVIEVTRSRNGNSWVGDRQLLGTVQYAFARADTGFMAGRHIEYVYKISSYNTPELGRVVIAKPVSVLFNQTIQTDAMGESLAVIGADPAEHVKMFWLSVVKALLILSWLIFCVYMWKTHPIRHDAFRKRQLIREFEKRKKRKILTRTSCNTNFVLKLRL